jgi:hypothetical protein
MGGNPETFAHWNFGRAAVRAFAPAVEPMTFRSYAAQPTPDADAPLCSFWTLPLWRFHALC